MKFAKLAALGGALAILAASALADYPYDRYRSSRSCDDGYGYSRYDRYPSYRSYRVSRYPVYRSYRSSRYYDDCYRPQRRRPSLTFVIRL